MYKYLNPFGEPKSILYEMKDLEEHLGNQLETITISPSNPQISRFRKLREKIPLERRNLNWNDINKFLERE